MLGVIAVKLITEEAGLIHLSPVASLGLVLGIFAVGIVASLIGDGRGPEAATVEGDRLAESVEGELKTAATEPEPRDSGRPPSGET